MIKLSIAVLAALIILSPVLGCDNHQHRHLHKDDEHGVDERNLRERPKAVASRCSTADLTPTQQQREREKIAEFRARNPLDAARIQDSSCLPTVTIDTVVAVVHYGTAGNVTTEDIAAQMDVLNAAFEPSGFAFNLREARYYENDAWFNDCEANESQMKEHIRLDVDPSDTGDKKEVLYMYICTPGEYLGYATFPFFDYGLDDGVVLLHSSLPGGAAYPYDEGDTGTHEVSYSVRRIV